MRLALCLLACAALRAHAAVKVAARSPGVPSVLPRLVAPGPRLPLALQPSLLALPAPGATPLTAPAAARTLAAAPFQPGPSAAGPNRRGLMDVFSKLSFVFDGPPARPTPVLVEEVTEPPQVAFFFNNHDASAGYLGPLSDFVRRHEAVLIESVAAGPEAELFQAVADGAMPPEQALPGLAGRNEPMDEILLRALHGSRVKVLPESVTKDAFRSSRRRIDGRLMARAQENLARAYDAFYEEGDADAAAAALLDFQTGMAKVHRLREEALLADLPALVERHPGGVGVVFGTFHARLADELQARGLRIAEEFHPAAEGRDGAMPYNRPLARLRQGRTAGDRDQQRKELLSYLLFYELLDRRFRNERFAAEKSPLYGKILARLSWDDLRQLALAVSEADPDRGSRRRQARAALRWLTRNGFVRPDERRYFRY